MHKKFLGLVAFAFAASPVIAWETQCNVDSFTDEEKCTAYQEGEGGTLAFTSMDSSKAVLFVYISNRSEYLKEDVFMARVGNHSTHDFVQGHEWLGLNAKNQTIMAGLSHARITSLLDQMADEDEVIRVRAASSSGYSEAEFTLNGFSEAWTDLSERRDLPW